MAVFPRSGSFAGLLVFNRQQSESRRTQLLWCMESFFQETQGRRNTHPSSHVAIKAFPECSLSTLNEGNTQTTERQTQNTLYTETAPRSHYELIYFSSNDLSWFTFILACFYFSTGVLRETSETKYWNITESPTEMWKSINMFIWGCLFMSKFASWVSISEQWVWNILNTLCAPSKVCFVSFIVCLFAL